MPPKHIMRIPAVEFLNSHGIKFQEGIPKGGVAWYNLASCPICESKGYQCGLSESFNSEGVSTKGYKCQHTGTTDPKEFYSRLGYASAIGQASKPVQKRNLEVAKKETKKGESVDSLQRANLESLAINQKRLRGNKKAMAYLLGRGLTAKTIEHFRIGLSKAYTRTDGVITEHCLVHPLFNRRGEPVKKNSYYNVPGLTLNPKDPNGWMGGAVSSSYAGDSDGKILFVAEGSKDVWMLWQQIQGSSLEKGFLIVTSTHGHAFPVEWEDSTFWKKFDQVYLGQDNDEPGNQMVARLVGVLGRDAKRVRVPEEKGKDWTDFFKNGATIEDFQDLLTVAPPATLVVAAEDPSDSQFGLVAYKPVDINGSFHKGHLHYTVRTMFRTKAQVKSDDGSSREEVHESIQTVIVRSDGAILTAVVQPAPKGTHHSHQVLRLTDGTLIARVPTPSPHATWDWYSIRRFHVAKTEGSKVDVRPLAVLVNDVQNYLMNQIWLPYPDDYVILAFTVLASYVQTIFDAVPLFLVNGPRGSGKTELGRVMNDVAANASVIGKGSAATIARLIDQTRGFVVLDDLESIGAAKVDAQFSELVQALKLSYKKTTATKIWTDTKTMKVEELNFFGIKMINNTTGVDSILGSRMLIIQTRKRLPLEKELWESSRVPMNGPPAGLRDELHTWAFEHCKEVSDVYHSMYRQGSDRSDEIAAPLRVIAEMTNDKVLQSRLEAGLARQIVTPKHNEDPVELLEEALHNIVLEGFRAITIQHVALEMKKLTPENYGQERTTDIAECFRPEWIGRQLRSQGLIDDLGAPRRIRLHGMNLRAYDIAQSFVKGVAAQLEKIGRELIASPQQPVAFCQGCDGCQYRNAGCEIMPRRLDAERTKPRLVVNR